VVVAGLLIGWVAIWFVLRGIDTLALGGQETTRLHRWLTEHRDFVGTGTSCSTRSGSPSTTWWCCPVGAGPAVVRASVPVIGWLGVVVVAAYWPGRSATGGSRCWPRPG
jgi:glycine betaine/proline transport system permease protein